MHHWRFKAGSKSQWGFYFDRIIGGHRNYRHSGRHAASRSGRGEKESADHPMLVERETIDYGMGDVRAR